MVKVRKISQHRRVHPKFIEKVSDTKQRMEDKFNLRMDFPRMTKMIADNWDIIEDEVFSIRPKRNEGKKKENLKFFK